MMKFITKIVNRSKPLTVPKKFVSIVDIWQKFKYAFGADS